MKNDSAWLHSCVSLEEGEPGSSEVASNTPRRQVTLTSIGQRATDYRAGVAKPVLRISRTAQSDPPTSPQPISEATWATLIVVGLVAVFLFLATLSWAGAVLSGLLLTVCAAVLLDRFGRSDAERFLKLEERLNTTIEVEVDEEGVRSIARHDEDWTGSASREEIARVYAQPWHRGVARVRVELRSGHHYTLVDGLFDEQEAHEVAGAIEERLR